MYATFFSRTGRQQAGLSHQFSLPFLIQENLLSCSFWFWLLALKPTFSLFLLPFSLSLSLPNEKKSRETGLCSKQQEDFMALISICKLRLTKLQTSLYDKSAAWPNLNEIYKIYLYKWFFVLFCFQHGVIWARRLQMIHTIVLPAYIPQFWRAYWQLSAKWRHAADRAVSTLFRSSRRFLLLFF